jgi:hypothetical protein
MSDRALQLNAYVRCLSDHDLNDLLVELPRERFAALAEVALAHPCVLDALALSFQRARPRWGEATRWDVLTGGAGRRIGAVVRRTWPGGGGGEAAGWFAYSSSGAVAEPAGAACLWSGFARRADAAAFLAWQSPASGARCLALAAHVRGLADDDLGELLVELPPGRFDALLEAALGAPVRAGEAA